MLNLKDGQRWGEWMLDADSNVLRHQVSRYEVDLGYMVNSASVVDCIVQVKMKSWSKAEDVGNFVRALDDIFQLQSNICRGGTDHRFDAITYLCFRLGRLKS